MKDIRPALRSFLLADPAIAGVVGDRVYPNVIPQGIDAACVVYTRISGEGAYHMRGPSGLSQPRYQIDAWARDIDSAFGLANLIKARVDGFCGVMGAGTAAVTVQGVFMRAEREDYDDAAQLHRVGRDYSIAFEEL